MNSCGPFDLAKPFKTSLLRREGRGYSMTGPLCLSALLVKWLSHSDARQGMVVQFDSLSLWERVGERAWASCNHNVAAGFSPQSVPQFFASVISVEESAGGSS